MKRKVHEIGRFRELGYEHLPDSPSLRDACGKRTPNDKDKVVRYLRSAVVFIFSPGVVDDCFDGSYAGSMSLLTDGTYAWPGSLAHYVERYDVVLPEEFERFMESNGWRVPEGIDPATLIVDTD